MYRGEIKLEDEEHSSADVDANVNSDGDLQPDRNEPLADEIWVERYERETEQERIQMRQYMQRLCLEGLTNNNYINL